MAENQTPKLIEFGPEWHEAGLAHRYLMPDGPGPHPTAVLIHGRLGDEDVMWLFQRAIPPSWLIVAPRAPLADSDGFSWHVLKGDRWPDAADFDPGVEALIHFLRALPRLYNADPERLYLVGFSQGAAVAYAAALRQPSLMRGIVGLVGFAPSAPVEEVAGRPTICRSLWRSAQTMPPYPINSPKTRPIFCAGPEPTWNITNTRPDIS